MGVVFNIDQVMREKNITNYALSLTTKIRPATIGLIRTNQAKYIRIEHITKLCNALDREPGEIICMMRDGEGSARV